MDTTFAPIALFIYKRPDHTRRMIQQLQRCAEFEGSPVYVFADGPKHPGDLDAVRESRFEARRLLGERAIFRESDTNLGIDKSEIAAITELCDSFGRVVVVEDDLVVAPSFLAFLNEGLARYANEPQVLQICAFLFDVPELRESHEAVFLPLASAWGWATWKRAWDLFDPLAHGWATRLRDKEERRRFNVGGHFDYTRMLAREMQKPDPAWDIRWYYSLFANGGLALHPPQSLVVNEGYDGTGTHNRLAVPTRQADLGAARVLGFPTRVASTPHTESVFEAIGRFHKVSPLQRVSALAKTMFALRGPR